MLPWLIMLVSREFLGLFSEFEGEHLRRFIREKGRLAASILGVSEKQQIVSGHVEHGGCGTCTWTVGMQGP